MQNIESNGVQNPESVELATLAGGLVALNGQLKSIAQMVKFLADRYILDHFEYGSEPFLDYISEKHRIHMQHAGIPTDRSRLLVYMDGDQLDRAVFEYIQFSHEQNQPEQ